MNCCGCFLEWMRRLGKGSLSLKLCTVWWWHGQQCLSLCQHCRGGLLGGQTLFPVSACSRLHLRPGNWCMVKKKKNQTSDFENSKSLTIRTFAVSTKIIRFCCLLMFCNLNVVDVCWNLTFPTLPPVPTPLCYVYSSFQSGSVIAPTHWQLTTSRCHCTITNRLPVILPLVKP